MVCILHFYDRSISTASYIERVIGLGGTAYRAAGVRTARSWRHLPSTLGTTDESVIPSSLPQAEASQTQARATSSHEGCKPRPRVCLSVSGNTNLTYFPFTRLKIRHSRHRAPTIPSHTLPGTDLRGPFLFLTTLGKRRGAWNPAPTRQQSLWCKLRFPFLPNLFLGCGKRSKSPMVTARVRQGCGFGYACADMVAFPLHHCICIEPMITYLPRIGGCTTLPMSTVSRQEVHLSSGQPSGWQSARNMDVAMAISAGAIAWT